MPAMTLLVAAATLSVFPIHGIVIETLPDHSAIIRTDAVTGMLPAQTRRYRLNPAAVFSAGTNVDALLDRSTRPPTLRNAVAAAPFAPGLPDSGRTVPIELGSPIPPAELVNQNGRVVQLNRNFKGKTLLLSFIFTRCPDRTLCPAISGKFAYLQQRLDSKRFGLAEVTLDPQYDSPAQLQKYGTAYGAKASTWMLLTGTGSTIQRLLNAFRINSMRVSADNFLHDDKLYIVAPTGRVADIVENAAWDPQAVLAQAQAIAGMSSNPFERFKLALLAEAIAICGGSQFAGIALLELSLFALITVFALAALWIVARILWPRHPPVSP